MMLSFVSCLLTFGVGGVNLLSYRYMFFNSPFPTHVYSFIYRHHRLLCLYPPCWRVMYRGTLVCLQWNSSGWQASWRQRETGGEQPWLTDGSADKLRVREAMMWGLLFPNNPTPVTVGPLIVYYICLCLSQFHSCCHLLPSKVSLYLPLIHIYTLSFPLFSFSSWSLMNECINCPLSYSFLTSPLHCPHLPPFVYS